MHDASAERKTAENLVKLLEEVMTSVQTEWGAIVIAIVTDASGESRKARRILGQKYPWLVVLDCYAHQVGIVHNLRLNIYSSLLDKPRCWRLLQIWCRFSHVH